MTHPNYLVADRVPASHPSAKVRGGAWWLPLGNGLTLETAQAICGPDGIICALPYEIGSAAMDARHLLDHIAAEYALRDRLAA